MKRNYGFGKIAGSGIEYAPQSFTKDGATYLHPTREEYALGGWLKMANNGPAEPAPAGRHWEPDGWEEAGGEIRNMWKLADDPPPGPRTFSKLKVVAALGQAGLWDGVKAYVEGAGLYDLFLAAQVFKEDDQYFGPGLSALQASLGLTDEQVEGILSACVWED